MILDGDSLGGLGKKQVCGLGVLCVVVQGSAAVQLMHHVGQLGWVIMQVMPSRVYIVLMLQTVLSCLRSPLPIVPYIKSPLSVVRIVVRFKGCFMLRFRFRRCFVLVMVHFWVFNPPRCEVVIEFLKLRRSLVSLVNKL